MGQHPVSGLSLKRARASSRLGSRSSTFLLLSTSTWWLLLSRMPRLLFWPIHPLVRSMPFWARCWRPVVISLARVLLTLWLLRRPPFSPALLASPTWRSRVSPLPLLLPLLLPFPSQLLLSSPSTPLPPPTLPTLPSRLFYRFLPSRRSHRMPRLWTSLLLLLLSALLSPLSPLLISPVSSLTFRKRVLFVE